MESLHTNLYYSVTPYPNLSNSLERVSPRAADEQTASQGMTQMSPQSIWQNYEVKPIIHPPSQRISSGLREAPLHISCFSLAPFSN